MGISLPENDPPKTDHDHDHDISETLGKLSLNQNEPADLLLESVEKSLAKISLVITEEGEGEEKGDKEEKEEEEKGDKEEEEEEEEEKISKDGVIEWKKQVNDDVKNDKKEIYDDVKNDKKKIVDVGLREEKTEVKEEEEDEVKEETEKGEEEEEEEEVKKLTVKKEDVDDNDDKEEEGKEEEKEEKKNKKKKEEEEDEDMTHKIKILSEKVNTDLVMDGVRRVVSKDDTTHTDTHTTTTTTSPPGSPKTSTEKPKLRSRGLMGFASVPQGSYELQNSIESVDSPSSTYSMSPAYHCDNVGINEHFNYQQSPAGFHLPISPALSNTDDGETWPQQQQQQQQYYSNNQYIYSDHLQYNQQQQQQPRQLLYDHERALQQQQQQQQYQYQQQQQQYQQQPQVPDVCAPLQFEDSRSPLMFPDASYSPTTQQQQQQQQLIGFQSGQLLSHEPVQQVPLTAGEDSLDIAHVIDAIKNECLNPNTLAISEADIHPIKQSLMQSIYEVQPYLEAPQQQQQQQNYHQQQQQQQQQYSPDYHHLNQQQHQQQQLQHCNNLISTSSSSSPPPTQLQGINCNSNSPDRNWKMVCDDAILSKHRLEFALHKNERMVELDSDGDTPTMIFACQQAKTKPEYAEALCAIVERQKNVNIHCNLPVEERVDGGVCRKCGISEQSAFYSSLSLKNKQGYSVLTSVIALRHPSAVIKFLLKHLRQSDLPRIFNKNDHIFTWAAEAYPELQPYVIRYC